MQLNRQFALCLAAMECPVYLIIYMYFPICWLSVPDKGYSRNLTYLNFFVHFCHVCTCFTCVHVLYRGLNTCKNESSMTFIFGLKGDNNFHERWPPVKIICNWIATGEKWSFILELITWIVRDLWFCKSMRKCFFILLLIVWNDK
jgi:hypothetical protein